MSVKQEFIDTVGFELSRQEIEIHEWLSNWVQTSEYASATRWSLYTMNDIPIAEDLPEPSPLPYPLSMIIAIEDKVMEIAERTGEDAIDEATRTIVVGLLSITTGLDEGWESRMDEIGWWNGTKA